MQVARSSEHPLSSEDIKLANTIAQAGFDPDREPAPARRRRTCPHGSGRGDPPVHASELGNLPRTPFNNSERVGYVYDQASVEPFTNPAPDQYDHEETVQVLDQQVGPASSSRAMAP
ncbi:MAG: hypothetical protein MZV64_60235 [Ignavibacteriales bacterium]|nr:hypothetical protein [Ignavibacteriales bacterium]